MNPPIVVGKHVVKCIAADRIWIAWHADAPKDKYRGRSPAEAIGKAIIHRASPDVFKIHCRGHQGHPVAISCAPSPFWRDYCERTDKEAAEALRLYDEE